ncbi:MAG TPA: porin family protein [Chitinophagaceae bacterium]|nr:porin family protein [Chitinophagaceae bacterium]
MKIRMLILMTACLFMAGAASAQGSFKLGVKGGATLYKIDGKAFKDEFQWGYHLGGVAEMMWSKNWGIQPEVLFQQSNTQTGYAFDTLYKSLNPGTIKNAKLNYLSIPVLLTWKPSPLISFQAGPNFSILMSQQKTLLQDGAEAFKNGNVSLLGGVQLNIMSFRVYGRYAVGLSNINNIDGSDEKWKSRGGQIGVALMF